jgi:hypothetical protein
MKWSVLECGQVVSVRICGLFIFSLYVLSTQQELSLCQAFWTVPVKETKLCPPGACTINLLTVVIVVAS